MMSSGGTPDGLPTCYKDSEFKEPRSCTCERVVFWLLWSLLAFIVLVGLTALVLYLIYQPKAPQFSISNVQVSNISLDNTQSSSAAFTLNGAVNFTLVAANPNKVSISIKYIDISVRFQNQSLGNTTIPAFVEAPGSSNSVNASLIVRQFPLSLTTGPELLADFTNGNLPLQVLATAGGEILILGVSSPTVTVVLSCDIVINPSTGAVQKQSCGVTSVHL